MLQPLRSSSTVSPLNIFHTLIPQTQILSYKKDPTASPTLSRVCVAESSELLSLLAERVEERKKQLHTLEQVK